MANSYTPKPLATDHVVLNEEVLQLVELLSEHAHDVWASQRLHDGWIYGPQRCDISRQHPCLIPYTELPESERVYDRNAVLGTVRAIVALGFTVSRAQISSRESRPEDQGRPNSFAEQS